MKLDTHAGVWLAMVLVCGCQVADCPRGTTPASVPAAARVEAPTAAAASQAGPIELAAPLEFLDDEDQVTGYALSRRARSIPVEGRGEPGETARAAVSAVALPVTVGLVFQGLSNLLGQLDTLLSELAGEIATVVGQLRQSVANTIADFERLLGGSLDQLIGQLDRMQRDFVQNVERLIVRTEQAMQRIRIGVDATALRLVHEADIVAYDALYGLPLRAHRPRVVYWTPTEYRDDGQPRMVEIHGNFLNERIERARPRLTLRTDGADEQLLEPVTQTDHVTAVMLPALAADATEPAVYSIGATYPGCEPRVCAAHEHCQARPLETTTVIAITSRPRIRLDVTATIRPVGTRVERSSFSYSFYDSDQNCAVDRPVDTEYCLPPGGWVIDGALPDPHITTANCGSGIITHGVSGSACARVRSRIRGCGQGCFIACWCNGRGWLGYNYAVPARRDVAYTFPEQVFEIADATQSTFAFRYDLPRPPESRVTSWEYHVRIVPSEGAAPIELTHASPSAAGAVSAMVGGTLSIEYAFPP